jgi:rhodanese-related sulfurtransferase
MFQKSLLLLLFFGILFAACKKNEDTSTSGAVASAVSAADAYKMTQQNALLIDVREKNEVAAQAYDVAHVVNIPMSEFESRIAEIPKDKPVILACLSGGRSQQALSILQAQGFTNAMNLEGGMMAWNGQGLPVR